MRISIYTQRPLADKSAICLSSLCIVHCLALPVVLATYPSTLALALSDEFFHITMVLVAVPISAFALLLGCRVHTSYSVATTGLLGLLFLLASATLGHDVVGESGEKILTVAGALLVAGSHILNFQRCRASDLCGCDA